MFHWMVDWMNGSGDAAAIFMKELWALGIYDKVLQSWKWPECAVTARNLRPILKSGPGSVQPLASPQEERLYLWEARWAVSPSFWAQGWHPPPAACVILSKHSSLPCPLPAFCLWKNFSWRISLIKMLKYRDKGNSQRRPNNAVIMHSQGPLVPSQGL